MAIQSSMEVQSCVKITHQYLRLIQATMMIQAQSKQLFLLLEPKMRRSPQPTPWRASMTEYLTMGPKHTSTPGSHSSSSLLERLMTLTMVARTVMMIWMMPMASTAFLRGMPKQLLMQGREQDPHIFTNLVHDFLLLGATLESLVEVNQ